MNLTTLGEKVNPCSLRGGWTDTLNRYEWSWFASLTPRDLPTSFTMVNRFKGFVQAIQREEQIVVGYYMAVEWFKSRKTYHLHALMGNLEGVGIWRWWHWWWFRYGRNKIEPYRAELGASSYLTKYVTKEVHNTGVVHIKNLHKVDKKNKCTML